MLQEMAQAIAQSWPAWTPQAAYAALVAAGLASMSVQPTLLPAGQIRIKEIS